MRNSCTINLSRSLRNLTLTALTIFLFAANNANASDDGGKAKPPVVEIKYMGTVDHMPVVKVEFDNADGGEYYLSLKDDNGHVFYSEVVKATKYSKSFQFDNTDLSGMRVTLSLKSKKENRTQVYEINKSVRQVEDVVIAKIQ